MPVLILLLVLGDGLRAAGTEEPAAPEVRREIFSPQLSGLEQRLFDQVRDGRFGRFSLLDAGLIAGGVEDPAELDRYRGRFETHVESLRRSGTVRGTPREKARAIFAYLHGSILRGGYCLQSSDLRQAFDHGRFNCVTSALLFNCLCDRFGLKTVALELPAHAMSRLMLPGEAIDVETTCPRWFALLDARSRRATPVTERTGNETAAQAELAARALARNDNERRSIRQVTDSQLVAMIYYNRGVDLLSGKQFAEAAAANAKAVRLDPENATARGNLLATINNWAIDLGMSGRYERAAELLRLGMAADPAYEAFRANYVELHRQWSQQLCRQGRSADALRLLLDAARLQPGERFFRQAALDILGRSAGSR